jgi:pheromone shutdown protein TraB
LIGTAHISEDSVTLVSELVRKIEPEVVMIELDSKRLGKIAGNLSLSQLGFDTPSQATQDRESPDSQEPSILSSAISNILQQLSGMVQRTAGAALGSALGSFYKSVEKLGFTTGGEFKAAIHEGLRVNARILLGDRDVEITLQRLASAITATDISM